MRTLRLVLLTTFPAYLAIGCSSPTSEVSESLAVKCAVISTTAIATPGLGPAPDPSPLPKSPAQCPVCRDADGNALPPEKCVVHDDVCTGVSGNPGGTAVTPTQELTVLEHAEHTPAIAYYGSCDNHGGQCENREFAYQITGTELAVATFTGGITTVYAVPFGAGAVKHAQPIFPILPATAFYHNPDVHVKFVDLLGHTVDGYGDMQNDCRVVADSGTSSDVPCWCTLC